MSYMKQGLKTLAFSTLAVLSLMVFAVAGAQAGGGEWLITTDDGAKTVQELDPQLHAINITQEGVGRLLILNLSLLLKCEEVITLQAHVVPVGGGSGSVEFKKCYFTDLKLTKVSTCTVDAFIVKFKALMVQHKSDARYILISPISGGPFTSIAILGAECVLPPKVEITGLLVAEIKIKSVPQILISSKLTLTLFPSHVLKYGANTAHLEADAQVALVDGEHAGKAWGFHPV